MTRKLVTAFMLVGSGAALALIVLLLIARGNPAAAQVTGGNTGPTARTVAYQPDTSSSNWKLLSDDVGVMIRQDDSLGLRGRLYVRQNGVWMPVATDGPADTLRSVPIR